MQPDAACGRRSRPKPEGYSDRLLGDADYRPWVKYQNSRMISRNHPT